MTWGKVLDALLAGGKFGERELDLDNERVHVSVGK